MVSTPRLAHAAARAAQRQVVALRPAGGEDHLDGLTANGGRHLRPRPLQRQPVALLLRFQKAQPAQPIGSIGRQYGQFSRPKGIAVDRDGNIYVSDSAHGNFQIFDQEGRLLLFVGDRSERPGPGVYMLPAGLDIDVLLNAGGGPEKRELARIRDKDGLKAVELFKELESDMAKMKDPRPSKTLKAT